MHCLDEESDLRTYEKHGILKFIMDLKDQGVGISVMKPFNAGQLLDAAKSPFHQALTPAQCLQYALNKPGVLTVVGGPGNVEQLKEILSFLDTTEEERD